MIDYPIDPLAGALSCIVIGGGAGGLELAIRMARTQKHIRVTLVDRRPTHIWKPRLHEIATGLLMASEEELSYAVLARRHGFRFVLGELAAVDLAEGKISLAAVPFPHDLIGIDDRPLLPARVLRFDTAVLAIGSTANDFGTRGVADHCYVLDTPDQAQRFHRAFLATATRVAARQIARMRVVIVGAGLTGVELVAELRTAAHRLSQYRSLIEQEQLEIAIVEMADRPLPGVASEISEIATRTLAEAKVEMYFGAKVSGVGADTVSLDDGRSIAADLVIWTSGIKGQEVASAIPGLQVDRSGRIAVNGQLRTLRIDGSVVENLYCIGDLRKFYAGTRGEGARRDRAGRAPAGQIFGERDRIAGREGSRAGFPLPLSRDARLAGNDAGGRRGANTWIRVCPRHGLIARLMYLSLYRMHLVELLGWWRAAALTLSGLLRRSVVPAVKLHWP